VHEGVTNDGRPVTVRVLSGSDTDIEEKLSSGEYRLSLEYELAKSNRREDVFLVARALGEPVGYCRIDNPHKGTYSYVHIVCVTEEQRRLGIGGMLVDAAIKAARTFGTANVYLISESAKARAVYGSRGFRPDRKLHGLMRRKVGGVAPDQAQHNI